MTDPARVPTSPPTQDLLEQYVLGLLDEPACEAIEARAFGDADVAASIDEVETDLVDDWTAGRLDGPTREAFARALQHRARLRARVDAARALGRGLGGLGRVDAGGSGASPRRRVSWIVGLATAAALLVSVAAWLARSPAARPDETLQTPQALARAAEPREPSGAREPTTAQSSPTARPSPAPAPRVVFAVRLPPGTTRASAVTPVRIPRAATHVDLKLAVAVGDDFQRYTITVTDSTGRVVGSVGRAALPPDRTVGLVLTREALRDGLHEVRLAGRSNGATEELLAVVQVSVTSDPQPR